MSNVDNTAEIDAVSPFRKRQRVVLWGAVGCCVLSLIGLGASFMIKSPQQLLAESAPQTPSTLTAPVEFRVLNSTVLSRGAVISESRQDVTPVAVGVGRQVVTAVHVKAGDSVRAGQPLLAVSGRPLIALPGSVPAYRDLKPGDKGEDISQLQDALEGLGLYRGGDREGHFGAATKAAVAKFFTTRGYDPADTGGPGGLGDRDRLKSARESVETAERQVLDVKRRIEAGETPAPGGEPLDRQLAFAEQKLEQAIQERGEVVERTGTMLPLSEFVFVRALPARVASFTAKVGDEVKAPLITLASGDLAVVIKLRPEQAKLVRPAMPAALSSESLGQEVKAQVVALGEVTVDPGDRTDVPGSLPAGTPYVPITLNSTEPLPASWAGRDVRVTITAAQTDRPVLVVPLAAVLSGADGRTTISIMGKEGVLARVEVKAGASGDGFVAITPIGADVVEGDRVVIGTS